MTSPNSPEWQRKMQDLKIETDRPAKTVVPEVLSSPNDSQGLDGSPWQEKVTTTQNWFEQIPASGKLAVMVGTAVIGLMLLKTVFQLVTSLITLGVVGVGLWFAYKLVIAPKNDSVDPG
jgi:hypothetical protein